MAVGLKRKLKRLHMKAVTIRRVCLVQVTHEGGCVIKATVLWTVGKCVRVKIDNSEQEFVVSPGACKPIWMYDRLVRKHNKPHYVIYRFTHVRCLRNPIYVRARSGVEALAAIQLSRQYRHYACPSDHGFDPAHVRVALNVP